MAARSLPPLVLHLLVVGFPTLCFDRRVLGELADLAERRLIRIVDLLAVWRDDDGCVRTAEFSAIEGPDADLFDGLAPRGPTVFGAADVEPVADALVAGQSAVLLGWEDRWLDPLVPWVRDRGSRTLVHEIRHLAPSRPPLLTSTASSVRERHSVFTKTLDR